MEDPVSSCDRPRLSHRATIAAGLLACALCASAGAQDAKPTTHELATKDARETLTVPADWHVDETDAGADALARWTVTPPKETEPLVLSLSLREGERDELLAAGALSKERHRAVRFKPAPHVIDDDPPTCLVPRVVNRRGFVVELGGPRAAMALTMPPFSEDVRGAVRDWLKSVKVLKGR